MKGYGWSSWWKPLWGISFSHHYAWLDVCEFQADVRRAWRFVSKKDVRICGNECLHVLGCTFMFFWTK